MSISPDKAGMSAQSILIQNLLRILTPEEIGDIATKHNGGKFLSLNDLVNERVDKKIYRDFSTQDYMEEFHEKSKGAKILPFKKNGDEAEAPGGEGGVGPAETAYQSLTAMGQEHIANSTTGLRKVLMMPLTPMVRICLRLY